MKAILFDPISHTYSDAEGKHYSGITSIISTYITPHKFDGIPEEVLLAAAERGKLIHEEIHFHILGFPPSEPSNEYQQWLTNFEQKLSNLDSEVLVCDNIGIASSIDIVEKNDDGTVTLYDIKCGSAQRESELWQLSIYAYLWELNHDSKVRALQVIRLQRNKRIQFETINRLKDEYVKSLFKAHYDNIAPDDWQNPIVTEAALIDPLVEVIVNTQREIAELEQRIKTLKETIEPVQREIAELMNKFGLLKVTNPNGDSISLRKASVRATFDSARFREDHEDLYNQYMKQTETKSSVICRLHE